MILFKKVSLFLAICFTAAASRAQHEFVHPGILHTQHALDRIYSVAQNKTMPQYGSFKLLKENPLSSASYQMKGPFPVIARDGQYASTKSKMEADFSAAYLNSLMWIATKDSAHANRALAILDAYADTLKYIPNTNDAPLLVGLEGTKIVNALEILRYTYPGTSAKQVSKIMKMVTDIFLPVCKKFYDTIPYTNGNWGPIVTKMYMSTAIFLNDRKMYNKAVEFYKNGNDNGSIKNYVSEATGQIQESGRDQGHCQLGIGAMATVCEIAWNQGDDLYGLYNNRLLQGFEYVAKFNLGNDVPFMKWKDITGKYSNWDSISTIGRGKFIPVYEMVYNHYAYRKGLAMPYTKQVIDKIRPEGYDRDQPAFGTLLFYELGK